MRDDKGNNKDYTYTYENLCKACRIHSESSSCYNENDCLDYGNILYWRLCEYIINKYVRDCKSRFIFLWKY